MAKSKRAKHLGLSDKIRARKGMDKAKKTLNPFEVHINKEKFNVLGKKSKNDKGLPGVSRAKALKKRKETLGIEYKLQNKSNTFLDRRIGEKGRSALSEEERILARFAAERIKQHKSKQSIFNLAEEEVLTHRGQTLEEIEKFDDPRSDDEDDDIGGNKYGGLQDEFVSEGHFGGGVLSKTNKDGAKSRKDLIDQLIAESKKRKAEKQKQRESTLDLTQKLDSEWKDLQPLVAKRSDDSSAMDSVLMDAEKKNADYDKTMRELKFEARGTPSDRLKSQTEVAKREKEKLDKLEENRLARMQGLTDEEAASSNRKHRSADDLDDGIELDTEPEFMVSYDAEGNPLMPEHLLSNDTVEAKDSKTHSFLNNKKNTGNSSEFNDENENECQSDKANSEIDESESEDEESNSDSADSFADLKEGTTDDEITIDENPNDDGKVADVFQGTTLKKKKAENNGIDTRNIENTKSVVKDSAKPSIQVKKTIGNVSISDKTVNSSEKLRSGRRKTVAESHEDDKIDDPAQESLTNRINADLLARKSIMEQAAKELPYTFEMPESYEHLQELLAEKSAEYQYVILERILKCNHPNLSETNKERLKTLFAYSLQYINDIFTESTRDVDSVLHAFRIFDRICPLVYDLAHLDPGNASSGILEVLKEKYGDFKRDMKTIPELDTLIFFKLASLLFPTSDFRHPVVTPCFYFMERILTKCRIRNRVDLSRGLFLVTLVLEYTVLSHRILTSAITFLRGVLHMCVFTSILNSSVVIPPFKNSSSVGNMLVLSDDCSDLILEKSRLLLKDLTVEKCDDEFKIRTLRACVLMIKEFFDNCNEISGQTLLFSPHLQLLGRLEIEMYPKCVAKEVVEIKESMEAYLDSKVLEPLRPEQRKPKALKLYEPLVEDIFNGKVRSKKSKEKTEHDKLLHKLKREKKGALREIRRDKAYIGALKIKHKLQSDDVRKAKVQQIYKEASIQQGELNKYQRKKK